MKKLTTLILFFTLFLCTLSIETNAQRRGFYNPSKDERESELLIINLFDSGVTNTNDSLIRTFRTKYPKSRFNNAFDSVYSYVFSLSKGALFPQICLKDSLEKEYCTSDFKGKIVYFDIWASHCSPCIKSLQYLETMVIPNLKYKDKIVFISLNLDKDRNVWLKSLRKYKFVGIQTFELDRRIEMMTKLIARGIPKSYIIDGKGRVYQYMPPLAFQNDGKLLTDLLNRAVEQLEQ